MEERLDFIEARLQSLENTRQDSSPSFSQAVEDTLNYLRRKIERASEDCQSMQFKVRELMLEVSSRAHADDVKQLELLCKTFCSRGQVEDLEAIVLALPSAEALNNLITTQQELSRRLPLEYVSQAAAASWVEQARAVAQEISAEQASRQDLKVLSNKCFSRITQCSQDVSTIQTKFRLLQEHSRDKQEFLMKLIHSKAEKTELQTIAQGLATKAGEHPFSQLRSKYLANVEIVEDQIKLLKNALIQQEAAVRRLDEVLLEKCSKFDFQHLATTVEQFSKHLKNERPVSELVADLNSLRTAQASQSVELASLKATVTPMVGLYSKNLDFDGQLRVLADETKVMNLHIGDKLDRREFYECLENFATVEMQRSLLEQIGECSQHTKLLVSQIGAMQKVLADPQRSQGLERIHREFLSKTAKKISDIILKPRPEGSESTKRFLRPHKTDRSHLSRSGTQTPGRRVVLKFFE